MTLKKLASFSVPQFMHVYRGNNNIHPYKVAVRVRGDDVCESALKNRENCVKVLKVIVLPTLSQQRENLTLLISGLMNTNDFLNPQVFYSPICLQCFPRLETFLFLLPPLWALLLLASTSGEGVGEGHGSGLS